MPRRSTHLLLSTIFVLVIAFTRAYAADQITETHDLSKIATNSDKTNRPILLLMSQEDCPYCRIIKREIINPMVLSGSYDDKIIMREFMIDAVADCRDFDGVKRDAAIIAKDYKIKVTPTLLFLGPDGKELTERIVGINTIELFSYYVDEAINSAVTNLKHK